MRPIDFPGGPLAKDSPVYVTRPPLEVLAFEEIEKVGSVIRIQAPRRMGKSSFLNRLLDHAEQNNCRVVKIDFMEADESIYCTLDRFLRWFSANVSRRLGQPANLDEFWDEDIGSKVSCTYYFEDYVLAQATQPIVLALNEVNRIFEYPEIAKDFLPLLRFWNEQSKQGDGFEWLRMVIVHSTEVYVPLKIHQSPFNVGCPIKLPEFSLDQTLELASKYGILVETVEQRAQIAELVQMVGGNPYRLSLAYYFIQCGDYTIPKILETATSQDGIYDFHLRDLYVTLNRNPELMDALCAVMQDGDGAVLEPSLAYKLDRLGLVSLRGRQATLSCDLYRQFFRQQLRAGHITQPYPADTRSTIPTKPSPSQSVEVASAPEPLQPSMGDQSLTVSKTQQPLLGGRYEIECQLGKGGFGTTYLAKDTHRPGHPACVVKKLARWFEPDSLAHARRLFATEAQTLEKLGTHDQIPRLFAYFEQDQDFFIVQELIKGKLFSDELSQIGLRTDQQIIDFLLDILPVVGFVHQHQVIHRDIKPENIMRRDRDGKLVLIDFGSAKLISTLPEPNPKKTVAIGTFGYSPWEQNQGFPRLNSDIYALGVIAIEMATGRLPDRLQCDQKMELKWRTLVPTLNPWLASIIDGMVRHNYRERYQKPQEIIKDLQMISMNNLNNL